MIDMEVIGVRQTITPKEFPRLRNLTQIIVEVKEEQLGDEDAKNKLN